MEKMNSNLLWVVWLFWLVPTVGFGQSYPHYTSTYVNDFADLLDSETEARIVTALEQVRDERGIEMTVVTIESRLDYGPSPSIEAFATGLFNQWGVGDSDRDDGIMVLVARSDRDMRIELGSGYPAQFDDRVKRVIDHHFIPWFKQDEYAKGIEAGVLETIKRTSFDPEADYNSTLARLRYAGEDAAQSVRSGGIFAWILGALGLAGGGAGAFGIRRYRRNRPRICDICDRKMVRLSETNDDAWLNHGQRVEENLASKNYDVWYCRHDDHVEMIGYRSWFSAYSACPNCNFRTLHSQRTVLNSATKSSTGKARVDYTCRNCDHSYSEHVTIAKLSSSSSSSGSSFGGGSSSGGGASGSW